ncbi:protein lethal(2)essential for life-like isoform X3 [Penaeus chinensis]|uniref:protein lethal(2)essential for life-like isoform X3 n=1 Tax=Penaeus chinensis TaxID=139456 RepID=UPI001FB7F149|nr:protein lethal(2)essential for life-like isoform X3 [Penaeus chinensis]
MAPIQMYAPSPVQEQSTSASDRIGTFRSFEERNSQENHRPTFSEDNQCYKIVVDVEAFMESGVRFDVVNENELIIESCAENGEGNSVSRKGLYRRFRFPSLVSVDTVRSVLSCDGILTITVAKKVTSDSSIGDIS